MPYMILLFDSTTQHDESYRLCPTPQYDKQANQGD
jgi:hypothetical protein